MKWLKTKFSAFWATCLGFLAFFGLTQSAMADFAALISGATTGLNESKDAALSVGGVVVSVVAAMMVVLMIIAVMRKA